MSRRPFEAKKVTDLDIVDIATAYGALLDATMYGYEDRANDCLNYLLCSSENGEALKSLGLECGGYSEASAAKDALDMYIKGWRAHRDELSKKRS